MGWVRSHPRHAGNVGCGVLLITAGMIVDSGRASTFMAAAGGLLIGVGSMGWMVDEAHAMMKDILAEALYRRIATEEAEEMERVRRQARWN